MTRTKVVCTIGPAVASREMIVKLVQAGMNVARINLSHGTAESHAATIALLKEVRQEIGLALAIMIDTRGPEIRVGEIAGHGLSLAKGDILRLVPHAKGPHEVVLTPFEVLGQIRPGMRLLLDDGYIQGVATESGEGGVSVEILNPGVLKSHKSVALPQAKIDLPAMTDQDIKDLKFACDQGVDWVAASFIRSPEHVFEIQKLLIARGKPNILVMAKIESWEGVKNFDAILQVANGIMVARGDLGVELPLEEVPSLQKMMVRKCHQVAKPVVTATQMLESMIYNPRPTRAEVSDVANAIYESSSGVMLSAETAMGQYPIETVTTMKNIIRRAEQEFDYRHFYDENIPLGLFDVATSVAASAVQTAYMVDAKAIVVFTRSGTSARLLSSFRPEMPIIALTPDEQTYHQLALEWGVIPLLGNLSLSLQAAIDMTSKFALDHKWVQQGDFIVLTTGSPLWVRGATNTLMVESIGDVVVRAQKGLGKEIHGQVALVLGPQMVSIDAVKGKIAVITQWRPEYDHCLGHAIGLVLQNHPEDKASEKQALQFAKTFGLPVLIRANGAMQALKEGQAITLDPVKKVLYKER